METRLTKGAYDTGLADELGGYQAPQDVQTKTGTDQHWGESEKQTNMSTTQS